MLAYTARRLLLLIPTFFLISLVLFGVLNLAPGRPGETGQAGGGETANGAVQRESYLIFKRQFNLDKPILLNLRWALDVEAVRADLVASADPDAPPRERIQASERLEDGGVYLVTPLVAILREDADPDLRRRAAEALTVATQAPLLADGALPAAELRAENQRIARENETRRAWRWEATADAAQVESVTRSWLDWYAQQEATYTFSAGERLSATFLDTRFARYWHNLLRADFGLSLVDRRPVLETLLSKVKYSVSLSLLSLVLAYAIAVPMGMYSAVRTGTRGDVALTIGLFVLYSLPTFFTGTVLLRLLSEGDPLGWFPTGGFQTQDSVPRTTVQGLLDVAWHLVLPVATYTGAALAALSRYARAGLVEVIRADYIRTARAKGLSEPLVILRHAARNGMIPVLTLLGGLLPALVGGSVVIEVVFGIPGMGLYLYDAINLRDYNVVMAVLQVSSLLALLGVLLSDLSYALADPRISFD